MEAATVYGIHHVLSLHKQIHKQYYSTNSIHALNYMDNIITVQQRNVILEQFLGLLKFHTVPSNFVEAVLDRAPSRFMTCSTILVKHTELA